jgi:hypothetical protein
MTTENEDYINKLPNDILALIFKLLSSEYLPPLKRVNKRWHAILSENIFNPQIVRYLKSTLVAKSSDYYSKSKDKKIKDNISEDLIKLINDIAEINYKNNSGDLKELFKILIETMKDYKPIDIKILEEKYSAVFAAIDTNINRKTLNEYLTKYNAMQEKTFHNGNYDTHDRDQLFAYTYYFIAHLVKVYSIYFDHTENIGVNKTESGSSVRVDLSKLVETVENIAIRDNVFGDIQKKQNSKNRLAGTFFVLFVLFLAILIFQIAFKNKIFDKIAYGTYSLGTATFLGRSAYYYYNDRKVSKIKREITALANINNNADGNPNKTPGIRPSV